MKKLEKLGQALELVRNPEPVRSLNNIDKIFETDNAENDWVSNIHINLNFNILINEY